MPVGATVVQAVYGLPSSTAPLISYVVRRHRDGTGALPLLASIGAGWW